MNLNLAHGEHPSVLPGWVNVDLRWPGVKWAGTCVEADAFRLPFRDQAFERCYLGHFLEHVRWNDLPAVLGEVKRVATGEVMVVGPALDLAVVRGEQQWLLDAIVGSCPSEGPGGHKWVPTRELHVLALELGGLKTRVLDVLDVRPPEWPNPAPGAAWQCAVLAEVPR